MSISLNNLHLANNSQQKLQQKKSASSPNFTGKAKFVNEVVGQVEKYKPNGEKFFETVTVSPKLANILSNEKLHKALTFAQKNSAVFLASASAAFACALRPATIMSLPGKDIEDKTYASGHSIASGAIGLVASTMLLNPLAGGLKAIEKNPTKFLGDGAKYLGDKTKNFGSSGAYRMAQKYVSMVPSIAIGIPQAILTIGLIPVVLKYVFGLEKKGAAKQAAAQSLFQNPAVVNFKSNVAKDKPIFQAFKGDATTKTEAPQAGQKVAFTGAANKATDIAEATADVMKKSSFFAPLKKAYHKVYDPILNTIAKAEAAILKTKTMENIVDKTAKKVHTVDGKIKNIENDSLITHLSVAQSALISGLYMNRTLNNKKLDNKHKTTLAINQGLVFGVSTALTYSLDKVINKKVNKLIDKFKVVNSHLSDKELKFFGSAIKTAKSLVIVGFIYRYFSPVAVTPIANWLGKKLQKNSEAKIAAAQNAQAQQQPQPAQQPQVAKTNETQKA